ncbi:MAG: histidinol-phosphatase HisJ family protein [Anaerolineales bacterium]
MTTNIRFSDYLLDQNYDSDNILTDYHMHSTYSPDASDSLDQMCQHALRIGFKEIAFTEHVEWHPDWKGRLDTKAYLQSVRSVKKKYAQKGLKVFAGVEVGNPHDYPEQAAQVFDNTQFEVIIAALHWLNGDNIHLPECFTGKDPLDVYDEYFREIRRMSECCDFDILAHFDRIFLTGRMLGYLPDLRKLEPVIRTTFRFVAAKGQILELNTKLFSHMPAIWKDIMVTFITWFREEGGSGISIGSDAHNRLQIGRHFDVAEEILKMTQFEVILPGSIPYKRERMISC